MKRDAAGAWPALAAYGLTFIASLVLSPLAAAVLGRGDPEFTRSLRGLTELAGFEGALLLAGAAIAARVLEPAEARVRVTLGWTRSGASAVGLVGAVAATGGASLALGAFADLVGLDPGPVSRAIDAALARASTAEVAVAVLGLAVVPAVCEETFFRGLLQTRLVRAWGPAPAVAATALAFGAFHLDPVQGTMAALLGLVLGAVRERLGGVRPAALAHAVNNAAFVVASAHGSRDMVPGRPLVSLVVGAALGGAGAWALRSPRSVRASTRAS